MNLALFTGLADLEYGKLIAQLSDYPYSFDEVMFVFRKFFICYEAYMGEQHPPLKREQIRKCMEVMPYFDGKGSSIADFTLEEYDEIIEQYFRTPFKNCDYRIAHFFSGDIRFLRAYETIY